MSWQREHQLTLHCLPTSRNTRRPPTWQPCPVLLVASEVGGRQHWGVSLTAVNHTAGSRRRNTATRKPDFISSLTSKRLRLLLPVKALLLSWIWNKRSGKRLQRRTSLRNPSCEWGTGLPKGDTHVFTLRWLPGTQQQVNGTTQRTDCTSNGVLKYYFLDILTRWGWSLWFGPILTSTVVKALHLPGCMGEEQVHARCTCCPSPCSSPSLKYSPQAHRRAGSPLLCSPIGRLPSFF